VAQFVDEGGSDLFLEMFGRLAGQEDGDPVEGDLAGAGGGIDMAFAEGDALEEAQEGMSSEFHASADARGGRIFDDDGDFIEPPAELGIDGVDGLLYDAVELIVGDFHGADCSGTGGNGPAILGGGLGFANGGGFR